MDVSTKVNSSYNCKVALWGVSMGFTMPSVLVTQFSTKCKRTGSDRGSQKSKNLF